MPAAANFSHSARMAALAAASSDERGSWFVGDSLFISIGFSFLTRWRVSCLFLGCAAKTLFLRLRLFDFLFKRNHQAVQSLQIFDFGRRRIQRHDDLFD